MLTVRFYRHGESAANAGDASSDPALIPLTERGMAQSRGIAEALCVTPDLIVMSPFVRAQNTALPTIQKFPDCPVEVWPVEEFTYLSAVRCADTTAAMRRPWVESYWAFADPATSNGPGTESFSDFVDRARLALRRLHGSAGRIMVFGHGQFMQCVRWLIVEPQERIDTIAMRSFRSFDIANPIANCEFFDIHHDGQRWICKTNSPLLE